MGKILIFGEKKVIPLFSSRDKNEFLEKKAVPLPTREARGGKKAWRAFVPWKQ